MTILEGFAAIASPTIPDCCSRASLFRQIEQRYQNPQPCNLVLHGMHWNACSPCSKQFLNSFCYIICYCILRWVDKTLFDFNATILTRYLDMCILYTHVSCRIIHIPMLYPHPRNARWRVEVSHGAGFFGSIIKSCLFVEANHWGVRCPAWLGSVAHGLPWHMTPQSERVDVPPIVARRVPKWWKV